MADTSGATLLGQEPVETQEDTTEEILDVIEAETAFMIFTTKDGNTVMTTDINIPITVERQPTSHEVTGALHNVLDDFIVQQTVITGAPFIAQHTMQSMMQQASKMQQARLSPAEQAALDQAMKLAR